LSKNIVLSDTNAGTAVFPSSHIDMILSIDPVTGNRTILSDSTHGSGPNFYAVYGLAIMQNVPEPSTFVLALGGLMLVAFRQLFSKRNHRDVD
jgi:hypothetical protein